MVVVFSDTWEISILCIGVSLFFITLPALTVLGFTNWNELKPHCGFYLHVPGCWWTWAFFICLSFEFYLWAMSVHILCPFLSSTVIYRSRIWILYQLQNLQVFSLILLAASLFDWQFPLQCRSFGACCHPICFGLGRLCFWSPFQEAFDYSCVLLQYFPLVIDGIRS